MKPKTIDKAPRDGSNVLLWGYYEVDGVGRGKEPVWVVGHWSERHYEKMQETKEKHPSVALEPTGWISSISGLSVTTIEPSHYLDLPVEPTL